jgi:hypothetical protein
MSQEGIIADRYAQFSHQALCWASIRRFLAAHGLTKRRPMTTRQTEGALAAAARLGRADRASHLGSER